MKFKATIGEFLKRVQKTLPAIPPKATLPVLEHLNFKLDDNRLRIIATDQDITIMSNIEVSGIENGSVLVPGRKLEAIIKALGSTGEFEFQSDQENFEIKLLTSRGNYTMKGLNPEDYIELPELFESKKPIINPEEHDGTIDASSPMAQFTKEEITKLATKTIFAVSNDEFRPAMTGVFFQFRSTFVNAVATDSYRLVKSTVNAEEAKYPQEFDIIIPQKSVDLLRKVDDDLIISFIETVGKISHARFDIGDTIYITRVINEKFPPYESVIPANNNLILTVSKDDLVNAIKRVSIFTSSISKQIKVVISQNMLTVVGEDEDSGNHAKEEIACDYSGESLEIGFNFKYLEDALNHIDSNEAEEGLIKMSFSESSKPALISPKAEKDELLMLLMPIRLS